MTTVASRTTINWVTRMTASMIDWRRPVPGEPAPAPGGAKDVDDTVSVLLPHEGARVGNESGALLRIQYGGTLRFATGLLEKDVPASDAAPAAAGPRRRAAQLRPADRGCPAGVSRARPGRVARGDRAS